jgi:hypothetical protein
MTVRAGYLPSDLPFDYSSEVPLNLGQDSCKSSPELKETFGC